MFKCLMFVAFICVTVSLSLAVPPQKQPKLKWVLAENAPVVLQGVLDNQEEIRKKEIEYLTNSIKGYEESISNMRKIKASSKEKTESIQKIKESIKDLQIQIADIKADKKVVISRVPPSSVGEVGMLETIVCKQKIDSQNALISISYTVQSVHRSKNGEEYVILAGINTDPVWFVGDTTNWIDDRIVGREVSAYCDSAKTYNTATGSNTVPELKQFTMDMFIQVEDAK